MGEIVGVLGIGRGPGAGVYDHAAEKRLWINFGA